MTRHSALLGDASATQQQAAGADVDTARFKDISTDPNAVNRMLTEDPGADEPDALPQLKPSERLKALPLNQRNVLHRYAAYTALMQRRDQFQLKRTQKIDTAPSPFLASKLRLPPVRVAPSGSSSVLQ